VTFVGRIANPSPGGPLTRPEDSREPAAGQLTQGQVSQARRSMLQLG
jgi:hypothetical protein